MLADLGHCTFILYFKGAFKYLYQRSGISLSTLFCSIVWYISFIMTESICGVCMCKDRSSSQA